MPFLSSLARDHVYVERVINPGYTTWSVASDFAGHCGLPCLGRSYTDRGNFHLSKRHLCIGDILGELGYRLHMYVADGWLLKFFLQHWWNAKDTRTHGLGKDWDLVTLFIENLIPELEKSDHPFVLHWFTSDTHPFPRFIVDGRCKNRNAKNSQARVLRSFDCFDQNVERLWNALKNASFWNNTEVIIHGDHPLMRAAEDLNAEGERTIAAIIAKRPKQWITKHASVYDIGPTILDLLGVEVHPPFPFGRSFFSDERGSIPNKEELQLMYDWFRAEFNWNEGGYCGNRTRGFCWRRAGEFDVPLEP
jgi:membrane-anchored protein YejM (alkaline phosphatase superfamily)